MSVTREDLKELDREISDIGKKVASLTTQVAMINNNLEKLVSKAEFMPVKLIVYGLAAGSMGAVLTSILGVAVGGK